MKILFINISDIKGGSAKAAYRVAQYLKLNYNSKVLFLVRSKYSNDDFVLQTRKNKIQAIIEKLINIFFNLIGLQYFYLPFSPKYILEKTKEFKPDVISLNNTIGGYFKTSDLKKLSDIAPIVWTFHDMWPFTANAAQTFGDESWKEMKAGKREKYIFPWIGINSGDFLLKHKKKIYTESKFSIITPSKWLYQLVNASPLMKRKRNVQIYHGIDLSIYRPFSKEGCRKKYNIPVDADVLIFSAERLRNNMWKGSSELLAIMSKINQLIKHKIYIILLGEGNMKEIKLLQNLVLIQTGYINSDRQLVDFYCCSDLTIYPTKADTLSLVLVESIACGTPAITYNIGGPNEVIVENKSGYLVTPFNNDEFADKTIKALRDKKKLNELSQSARIHAEKKFSIESVAKEYYSLFNEIIQ